MDFLNALKRFVAFCFLSAFALVRILVAVAVGAYFGLGLYLQAALAIILFGVLTWFLELLIDYGNRHILSRALAAVTEVRDHVVTIRTLMEEIKGG